MKSWEMLLSWHLIKLFIFSVDDDYVEIQGKTFSRNAIEYINMSNLLEVANIISQKIWHTNRRTEKTDSFGKNKLTLNLKCTLDGI